ncbi:RluA family pseudouridine synthase [Eubacterium aggregans]|uniref:RluA family pseudouridine synthase n=1 Tax=Eubacterium aggregans TaxID=81409 RepID=UPI003F401B48
MKELYIDTNAAGQRIDRYLLKCFPRASKGFLQKMLRKKQITLNQGLAQPQAFLNEGDCIQVFFSDETIAHFSDNGQTVPKPPIHPNNTLFDQPVYEDEHILVVNKPDGLLTQPDASGEPALSDWLSTAIKNDGGTFHPAPSNRLDKNTSGIIMIPKDYPTQKLVNAAIRSRSILKKYLALVKGTIAPSLTLRDQLVKDGATNQVSIGAGDERVSAHLSCVRIASNQDTSLVRILLFTGRAHQIRVQLAAANHPIIGDPKYGNRAINKAFLKRYGLRRQLLHSVHYAIPDLSYDFKAPVPQDFQSILRDLGYTEVD